MPTITNVFGSPMEVDKLAVHPSKQDWEMLAIAQIFCPRKTWVTCPLKEVCVDGNEGVWIECPSMLEFAETSPTRQ